MRTSQQRSRLPSKSQYLANVDGFAPSNLHKASNGGVGSLMSTANRTFNQNSLQDTLSLNPKKVSQSEKTTSFRETVKPNQFGRTKSMQKSGEMNKKGKPVNRKQKKPLMSASMSSLRSASSSHVQRAASSSYVQRGSQKDIEVTEVYNKDNNRFRESRSASEVKENLPGNYDHPHYLYKGTFQNNYVMGGALEFKDQELNERPVRKGYKDFEQEYARDKKLQPTEGFQSTNGLYLEQKLSLYKLVDNDDLQAKPQGRKMINISESINNSEALFNPNYMPMDISKEMLPGALPGKRTISEREKAAIFIQRVAKGVLTRLRVKKMKQTLKKHFNGDLSVDPYEIEFYDMNIDAFKKVVANEEDSFARPSENENKKIFEDDPSKKLLSNTFYSVLRSNFFPEDPMDYVVLAETRNDPDALFPKLIYEDQKAKSKDVMMYKKFTYLFEKPIMKDVKTDEKSVIKNFLKTNLSSITAADLKVDKFKIEYKTPIKVQTKVPQTFNTKTALFSPAQKPSKFGQDYGGQGNDREIHTEISEDYSEDFNESAIKESLINESIHGGRENTLLDSIIKESLIKDGTISESIRESYDQSPPHRFGKKMSNKSISEDIEMESRRFDKNASYKSIQEDIPISESINMSRDRTKTKKGKVEEEIEEDYDFKDSYDNDKFESLDESIQESIDKFQASRRSINNSASSSPVKIQEEKPLVIKPVFKTSKPKEEPLPAVSKAQTLPAQKPLEVIKERVVDTKPIERINEDRRPMYEEREEREERRTFINPNLINMPTSRNAEILYANFQKELDKMVYMDNLTEKVHAFGNTIENLYQQKEYNLLHSIQNKGTNPQVNPQLNSVTLPAPTAEGNSMMYLMQKYNTMERSMMTISNQLNFLINNFTGGNINQANNAAGQQRKPRPIIPVRRTQSVKVKDKTPLKPQAQKEPERIQLQVPVQVKEKERVQVVQEKPKEKEKVQVQAQVPVPVQAQKVKEQEKEIPKVIPLQKPKEVLVIEEKPKPKFTFKLPSQPKKESSFEEIEEDISITVAPEVKPEPVIKKETLAPVIKKEAPAPAPTMPIANEKPSTLKSKKFGKWQQESSSEVSEEIIEDLENSAHMKQEKTLEEEDFSVKDYSDSFERLSPINTVKKTSVQKFEDKKVETPKSQNESSIKVYEESFEDLTPASTNRKFSPQKTEVKKIEVQKPQVFEDDILDDIVDEIEDLVIDDDLDLPMETKKIDEKKVQVQKVVPQEVLEEKKPKEEEEEDYENIDDFEEYIEEEFEELSLPSQTKIDESPVKPVAALKPQQEVQPEIKFKEAEKSESSDIEASQDSSVISWQEPVINSEEAEKVVKVEAKAPLEKKIEKVADKLVNEVSEEIQYDLSPRRNLAQIEDAKAKLKHEYIAEHNNFDIQDIPPATVEKINQSHLHDEEDMKHLEHTANVSNQVKVLTEKMAQAKKSQIIGILINHINFADPQVKLTIFDKNPIKDESITDAYNEILLNLFQSEFRKLNNEFSTTQEVEKKMLIKLDNIIQRAKDVLLKRISHTPTELEEYKTLGRNFKNIYETLRNKKLPGEENDFYEEEGDIKRLIEEENNRVKETLADQVMETLFEDLVQDLLKISNNRKKF